MDLNKIKTFLLAAATLDLQATAKKIYRTQPAVTQQIKGLERELGIRLFERKGRGLILTSQGQRLADTLELPFQVLQDSLDSVIHREAEPKGTIRIGILSDHAVSNGIFSFFADFCQKYSKIDLQIKLGTSKDIEPLLLDNQLDFGILIYLAHPRYFERLPLAPATHHPVSSPHYLKNKETISSVSQLLKLDLLDQDPAWWSWTQWFECHFPNAIASLHHLSPRIAIPSYTALKEVVMNGFGIAMLPEYLIQEELKAKSLMRLWPRKKSLKFDLCLVHRKTKQLQVPEELLLEVLRNSQEATSSTLEKIRKT